MPLAFDGLKECAKCGVDKPVAEFHQDSQRPDGRHPYCKRCKNRVSCESARKNPERHRIRSNEWRSANRERAREIGRNSQRKRTYGLTAQEYEALLVAQGGVCAACGQPEKARRKGKLLSLAVDHCHTSGEIRGLLCLACNRALGLLGDSPERIQKLKLYSERKAV